MSIACSQVHRAHLALVVLLCVPVHASCCVQSCSILLHDDACYDVLVRLVERLQLSQAVVNDVIRPISHLLQAIHRAEQVLNEGTVAEAVQATVTVGVQFEH
jgi:hypothetical protein